MSATCTTPLTCGDACAEREVYAAEPVTWITAAAYVARLRAEEGA